MKVLWIGLGSFGFPIAQRVIDSGIQVVVSGLGREQAAQTSLLEYGATAPSSSVISEVDVIVSMLPRPSDVEQVRDQLDGRHTAKYWLDMTTGTKGDSQDLAKSLSKVGTTYVDSPVSGSKHGARNGGLTMWLGSTESAGAPLRPLIDSISANSYFMGGAGLGCAMKLVNQCIHIQNMAAIGEGMTVAKQYGLPEEIALTSLQTSSANSSMLERFSEKIGSRDSSPMFQLELATKDLSQAIDDSQIDQDLVPNCTGTKQWLEAAIASGKGKSDFSLAGWPRQDLDF